MTAEIPWQRTSAADSFYDVFFGSEGFCVWNTAVLTAYLLQFCSICSKKVWVSGWAQTGIQNRGMRMWQDRGQTHMKMAEDGCEFCRHGCHPMQSFSAYANIRLQTLHCEGNSAHSNGTKWLISSKILSHASCTCSTNTKWHLHITTAKVIWQ